MAAVRIVTTLVEEVDSGQFRKARIASGLSAVQLSRRAGQHDQFVSRLERGLTKEIHQETVEKLAQAMAGEGNFEGQGKEAVLAMIRGQASFQLTPMEAQPDSPEKDDSDISGPVAITSITSRRAA